MNTTTTTFTGYCADGHRRIDFNDPQEWDRHNREAHPRRTLANRRRQSMFRSPRMRPLTDLEKVWLGAYVRERYYPEGPCLGQVWAVAKTNRVQPNEVFVVNHGVSTTHRISNLTILQRRLATW